VNAVAQQLRIHGLIVPFTGANVGYTLNFANSARKCRFELAFVVQRGTMSVVTTNVDASERSKATMAAKSEVVKVRIEPVYRDALEQIGETMQPPASVSALVRQSVVEFVRRRHVKAEWAEASTLDDHDSLGVIPS